MTQDIRTVLVPERIVNEKIISVFHQLGKFVLVSVQECDENGDFLNIAKTIEINDKYYKELISFSPIWAEGKPEGSFRIDDIWIIIDKIRNDRR